MFKDIYFPLLARLNFKAETKELRRDKIYSFENCGTVLRKFNELSQKKEPELRSSGLFKLTNI